MMQTLFLFDALNNKRKVLVMLGWHDVRTLLALARHARAAGWHLETRHFFNETLPHGWSGDGLIVSNPVRSDMRVFIRRQAPKQPTVLIEANNPGLRVSQVAEDNRAAGRLAAEHFLELGHKHFVWWSPHEGTVPVERWEGFRDTLERAGHTAERLEYQAADPANDWSRRRAWLVRRLRVLPRPIALFALDDQLAAEAVEMCLESKLRVPQDVAVVGVGNIELACETSPVPITSVDNAPDEVALAGARLLDRLMAGGRAPKQPILIPPRGLVVRHSSAALAVTHPGMLRAVAHVQEHLTEPLDIERLARASGVSRRTLYYLFASELRCTPLALLNRERMAQARRLLEKTDASVKEVVVACGFGTARTLHRQFRRLEGHSPLAWKKARRARRSLLDQP
ncbi:MAG: substrate-binding domain-containing protein [Chloroflexi bacterium]|nr:substrate-binding domain-containing protein [Chloroflexota bacterium]